MKTKRTVEMGCFGALVKSTGIPSVRSSAVHNYVAHAMCPLHLLQPDCGCGSHWDPDWGSGYSLEHGLLLW